MGPLPLPVVAPSPPTGTPLAPVTATTTIAAFATAEVPGAAPPGSARTSRRNGIQGGGAASAGKVAERAARRPTSAGSRTGRRRRERSAAVGRFMTGRYAGPRRVVL